jgi:FAD/FMN-containing dehydrogenase
MKDLLVSPDIQTIEVGPGNRWVDVYGALAPYGLYCVGGRLKTIGVSGLTLIGGFHYFNNKYGFSMDNVVQYDVVLGNGSHVVSTASSHSDLFWALKGGANNFGIVTKFTLQAYPIPEVSTTIQIFDETAIPDFMKATSDLTLHHNPDLAAGQVLSVQYNATTKAVSATLLGVQEGTESPPSTFQNFTTIPSDVKIHNVTAPVNWHSALESPNQMFR